ncbi:4-oxalocrotonate tautomerase [Pseudalkalibacillus sp. A8]|uniref:4-oxalocrotonate tautomerase n=1 Tax=Pseudalkalibacillus sp. A8 TaxID=3382641 RepID=UPI0038B61F51
MPIIQVQVLKGREEAQINTLISNVTDAVVKSLDVNPGQVRVLITEIADTHWGVGGKSKKDMEAY